MTSLARRIVNIETSLLEANQAQFARAFDRLVTNLMADLGDDRLAALGAGTLADDTLRAALIRSLRAMDPSEREVLASHYERRAVLAAQ